MLALLSKMVTTLVLVFSAQASVSLYISPLTVSVGNPATASWNNSGTVYKSDWIGIYPSGRCTGSAGSGTCPEGSTAWDYLCGGTTVCTSTPTSPGQVTLTIPSAAAPGSYEAYYLQNGGYTWLSSSQVGVECMHSLVHANVAPALLLFTLCPGHYSYKS